MGLFAGLDVSQAKAAICVISEHGKIQKEAEVASAPEALVRWIGEQNGTIAAPGVKSGLLSQWLHRGLTRASLRDCANGSTASEGALKAMPLKTGCIAEARHG